MSLLIRMTSEDAVGKGATEFHAHVSTWNRAASNILETFGFRKHRQLFGFQWRAGCDTDNLGFFTGVAGIGYTLLRILRPGTLPCALRWDWKISAKKSLKGLSELKTVACSYATAAAGLVRHNRASQISNYGDCLRKR